MMIENRRILIADDLPDIHEDYRKILTPRSTSSVTLQGAADFAPHLVAAPAHNPNPFQIDTVMQGEDAIQAVTHASAEGRPFAMIFLDVRMPPGIDGIETAQRLREIDPTLQVVLCTAYSDYTFADISRRFKESDGLLILKKPFDPAEVQQLAHALCRKWMLSAENKALLSTLEARVRQRTSELEQAKGDLETALRRAEAASRAKTDFIRCVSHELNTPLNGILGAASLIELSSDPESAEMGAIMLESSERLNRLFSRILLYLEIDTRTSNERHSIKLKEIEEKAIAPYQAQAARKGLGFHWENTCPPSLWLRSDSVKLAQAIECLVENAVKFTARGQVTVRLHANKNGTFVIEVEDSGPGIQEPQLTHLYELFRPGDLQTQRNQDGIGMGLTLAKRIAEHMGGTIEHRNREAGGSLFILTLPVQPP